MNNDMQRIKCLFMDMTDMGWSHRVSPELRKHIREKIEREDYTIDAEVEKFIKENFEWLSVAGALD